MEEKLIKGYYEILEMDKEQIETHCDFLRNCIEVYNMADDQKDKDNIFQMIVDTYASTLKSFRDTNEFSKKFLNVLALSAVVEKEKLSKHA